MTHVRTGEKSRQLWRLPARAASVPIARRLSVDYARSAGAGAAVIEAVRLAVSEAVANAILHAYPHTTSGVVEIAAWILPGELWLLVADDGVGFRSDSRSTGLGLGLGLMARCAEELAIVERSHRGTEIRLRFPLPVETDQRRGSASSAISPASPRFSTTR